MKQNIPCDDNVIRQTFGTENKKMLDKDQIVAIKKEQFYKNNDKENEDYKLTP